VSPNALVVLAGNKTDLSGARKVLKKEAQALALSQEVQFFETSAKTGENIREIFQYIGTRARHWRRRQWQPPTDASDMTYEIAPPCARSRARQPRSHSAAAERTPVLQFCDDDALADGWWMVDEIQRLDEPDTNPGCTC